MPDAPVFEVGDRIVVVVDSIRVSGKITQIDIYRKLILLEKDNGSCLWVPFAAVYEG